jgi:hypothetical protein
MGAASAWREFEGGALERNRSDGVHLRIEPIAIDPPGFGNAYLVTISQPGKDRYHAQLPALADAKALADTWGRGDDTAVECLSRWAMGDRTLTPTELLAASEHAGKLGLDRTVRDIEAFAAEHVEHDPDRRAS